MIKQLQWRKERTANEMAWLIPVSSSLPRPLCDHSHPDLDTFNFISSIQALYIDGDQFGSTVPSINHRVPPLTWTEIDDMLRAVDPRIGLI